MDRQELITALEDAGLSPYQADAYVTVLELGAAPATRIAERSGVPDPRIYDVLRDLEDEGYVELYERESLYARAHSLETVTADLQRRAERFTTAATEIERRWTEPPAEESSVSIVRHSETVLKNAIQSVRTADRQVEVSLGVDQFETLQPALAAATANDVTVNLSIHTDNGPEALPSIDEIAAVCAEARHRRLPAPFTAIVDRTKTFFAPHAGSTNEYGVLVNDRTHTYVFHWYFLTTQWDVWEPFYRAADGSPPTSYLNIRYCVQDIAPLVADGHTVRVRVEGTDIDSGLDRTVTGTVVDVFTGGDEDIDRDRIASYGGQVGMVVDTGDETVEVGGWGAMIEALEAHRVTVLGVE